MATPSLAVLAGVASALTASPLLSTAEGFRVDLGDSLQWDALKPPPGGTSRLVLVLGGALGRWDPAAFVSELRRLLRRGDHLLVDVLTSASEEPADDQGGLRGATLDALARLGVPAERVEVVMEACAEDHLYEFGAVARRAMVTIGRGPALSLHGLPLPQGMPLEAAREVRLDRSGLAALLERVGALDIACASALEGHAMALARPSA